MSKRIGIVEKVVAHEGWSLMKMRKTYWWVLVASGNHEALATSEVYTTKAKRDQSARQVADQVGVRYEAS